MSTCVADGSEHSTKSVMRGHRVRTGIGVKNRDFRHERGWFVMRTRQNHSLALAALAVLAVAADAAAQDRAAGLLNTLGVRELVARAEPGDHVRLGAHFTALGERYTAEAKRHISMAQSFVGNPNRSLGTGMNAHCGRLASLNTEAATTVRELATYHETLAAGASATSPIDAARFEGGAGAPEPTDHELEALAAKAHIPSEHRALEEYFVMLAKRYTADANAHVALAQTYRGTRIAQAAVHHDRVAALSRDAAQEATDAAAMHEQLAAIGR
jgi:hypothetical protein